MSKSEVDTYYQKIAEQNPNFVRPKANQLECEKLCTIPGSYRQTCDWQSDGGMVCEGFTPGVCQQSGRPPPGMQLKPMAGTLRWEAGWATQAWALEVASVSAFTLLENELRFHQAPPALIDRAKQAATEEHNHAILMNKVMSDLGGKEIEISIPEQQNRTLFEIACDNVVHGCIGESWAALMLFWSAERSSRPEFQAIFKEIAQDEAGHAAFSWELHRWLMTRISETERVEIHALLEQHFKKLHQELMSQQGSITLGLPSSMLSKLLLNELQQEFTQQGMLAMN
jgi:hypothetical protein